ncbi:MAG: tetratricopeptide repeat protein, partial [Rhodospirillales bacterium]|nr:tetratricopeptide repeat protein [Rhodospirillales bacterium]
MLPPVGAPAGPLDPAIEEDPRALYVLGLVGLRAGHLDEAIYLLREALRRDPTHEGAQRNLVRALLAAGRATETLAAADDACAAQPDSAELHFARGTALNALRQPAAACAALERSVALDPEFAPAWLNLGNACADLDDWTAAEAHVRRAVTLDPTLAEAQASLSYLLTVQGR